MKNIYTFQITDEAAMRLLAELCALKCWSGCVIALQGELGAGKTTFARAFVRAMLDDPLAEVPSPTFPIVQSYETLRSVVRHFDLYRISSPDELIEIGFEDEIDDTISLIEWPSRAGEFLPDHRVEIQFEECADDPDARVITISAMGEIGIRIGRVAVLFQFLEKAYGGREGLRVSYLQGDASSRAYARVFGGEISGRQTSGTAGSRILMDSPRHPDGPPIRDGKPYSRIAHLAEDIRPFIAISDALRRAGFSAPRCDAVNLEDGVALFEDLGGRVFDSAVASQAPQELLWARAVDVLLALRNGNLPPIAISDAGIAHRLPYYDASAMTIEIELLLDWYLPFSLGNEISVKARAEFVDLWQGLFAKLGTLETTWTLRDFHSPNLIWLPERQGIRSVGVIDFQDAQISHPAYDLVSLLQDARVDVPEAIEVAELARYSASAATCNATFDDEAFRWAYAVLGAQRNTKILGIFARLAKRDLKPQYLQHIPRIWRYLRRNLEHPSLCELKAWYDMHLAADTRQVITPNVITGEHGDGAAT